MNLVHQDPEASVHDLVDFLGVELLGEGGVIGNISKENCDDLPFSLDGAASREDLLGQELGRVGLGLGEIDVRGVPWSSQIAAAFIAEIIGGRVSRTTLRA